MISFRVPCIPIAQPRPRAVAFAGHARVYGAPHSHPIHAFRATVRLAAEQVYSGPPADGPIELRVRFLLPRPQSKVWRRKPMPREWHVGREDADNLIKGVKDSLSGLLWRDDHQVAREVVEKFVCAGDEQPGVEIVVEALGELRGPAALERVRYSGVAEPLFGGDRSS